MRSDRSKWQNREDEQSIESKSCKFVDGGGGMLSLFPMSLDGTQLLASLIRVRKQAIDRGERTSYLFSISSPSSSLLSLYFSISSKVQNNGYCDCNCERREWVKSNKTFLEKKRSKPTGERIDRVPGALNINKEKIWVKRRDKNIQKKNVTYYVG